jgi:hypothetical protein
MRMVMTTMPITPTMANQNHGWSQVGPVAASKFLGRTSVSVRSGVSCEVMYQV